MTTKPQLLTTLRDEFDAWETLLASLSEAQLTAPTQPPDLSIKDILAHLMGWQQRTIARCEAALRDGEPEYPSWPQGLDPEADDVDGINAWIHATYQDTPWATVSEAWRTGFLRLLDLAEATPEDKIMEARRFSWMEGHPLSASLEGSLEHHQEHREPLVAWVQQQGESAEQNTM